MRDSEELLDEVISQLRNDPTPEMPDFVESTEVTHRRHWKWAALVAGSVAASLAAFLIWRVYFGASFGVDGLDMAKQPEPAGRNSRIVVMEINLVEPLDRMEQDLDQLDREIELLRDQAALLDVKRKADELLAQF